MQTSAAFTTRPINVVLKQIRPGAQALFGKGKVASYIPALAQVQPRQFGMVVAQVYGATHSAGGGIVAFVPGKVKVGVWSPKLDAKTNSVLVTFALKRLVQLTGWH